MLCSFLTKAPWLALKGKYVDPTMVYGWNELSGDGPASYVSHQIAVSYFDADKDGRVTVQEFYDIKVVKVLRRIFDGFDKNNDGVVDKSEASLSSLLRPQFFKSLTEEIFDLLDVNNDNTVSIEDVPYCWERCDRCDEPVEPGCGWMNKNDTLKVCRDLFHKNCDKALATYPPLLDT